MNKHYKIRKGLNIKIAGEAKKNIGKEFDARTFIIRPTDYIGLIPKILLKDGDFIKRGEAVFVDKYNPEIRFTSPVSGQIASVVRGEKRKLLKVIIKSDKKDNSISFKDQICYDHADKIKNLFLNSGVWPYIKQRPYGTIAEPNDIPRDIFVTFFDSAPLAPDYDFILKDKKEEINIALKSIKKLTDGNIYINFREKSILIDLIDNPDDYIINHFNGPHPAGLVGTHINKIKPINKNEIIWTLNAADLPVIGHLLLTGEYLPNKLFAIAGSEVKEPCYYPVRSGADISELIVNIVKSDNYRCISGNVLTGTNVTDNQSTGFYDHLISIIPEGNKFEMFGWIQPGFKKFSVKRTFASKIVRPRKYNIDTNYHGGERAYVVTGEYEKVCSIDIFPQLLIKSILVEDIEKMENLGIYEVIEEDLALCEFVCTSKIEVQSILRKGLDLIRKEMS